MEPREATGVHVHGTGLSGEAHATERRPPGAHAFTEREAHQARRLAIVVGIVGAFFVLEAVGAVWSGSVALQADAVHMLTDVLALSLSLLAMRVSVREPSDRFTFGLRRAEPVAAILGACLVLSTTVVILGEAVEALRGTRVPEAGTMLAFSVIAVFVNGVSAWLLHDAIHAHPRPHAAHTISGEAHGHGHGHAHAHGHALNLRGAWLHLLGDTLGALAVLVAAVALRFGGWRAADPVASFVVAAVLLVGAARLLRDAAFVVLEAAPRHLPVATTRAVIAGFPEVSAVEHLHIWTLGAGHDALTVHVRTTTGDTSLGERLAATLRSRLGAEYVTVQVHFAPSGQAGREPQDP